MLRRGSPARPSPPALRRRAGAPTAAIATPPVQPFATCPAARARRRAGRARRRAGAARRDALPRARTPRASSSPCRATAARRGADRAALPPALSDAVQPALEGTPPATAYVTRGGEIQKSASLRNRPAIRRL